jgi:hypothetical protein
MNAEDALPLSRVTYQLIQERRVVRQRHKPGGAPREFGAALLEWVLVSDTVGLMRLVIAEMRRFPDLGSSANRTARGQRQANRTFRRQIVPMTLLSRIYRQMPPDISYVNSSRIMADIGEETRRHRGLRMSPLGRQSGGINFPRPRCFRIIPGSNQSQV